MGACQPRLCPEGPALPYLLQDNLLLFQLNSEQISYTSVTISHLKKEKATLRQDGFWQAESREMGGDPQPTLVAPHFLSP